MTTANMKPSIRPWAPPSASPRNRRQALIAPSSNCCLHGVRHDFYSSQTLISRRGGSRGRIIRGMFGRYPAALATAVRRSNAAASPQPFPRPGAAQPAAPAPQPTVRRRRRRLTRRAASAAGRQRSAAPTEATLGVPIYPARSSSRRTTRAAASATTCSASAAPFTDLVAYYRTVLKQKGELIFDAPATHEFDVGRFREETMAFPPGVTIKDFQSRCRRATRIRSPAASRRGSRRSFRSCRSPSSESQN